MPMGSLWVVARTGGEKWIRDMSFRELRYIWYADLYRYEGRADSLAFVKHFLLSPGFTYTFYLRLCAYLAQKRPRVLFLPLYILARICLRHYSYKFSIFIPPSTRIGIGFYIGHCGDIHVNPDTQIGRNCNMSQGVTLGQANRGSRKGTPVVLSLIHISTVLGHSNHRDLSHYADHRLGSQIRASHHFSPNSRGWPPKHNARSLQSSAHGHAELPQLCLLYTSILECSYHGPPKI